MKEKKGENEEYDIFCPETGEFSQPEVAQEKQRQKGKDKFSAGKYHGIVPSERPLPPYPYF